MVLTVTYIWYTVGPHGGAICNVDLAVTYIWYTVVPHAGAVCNVDLTVTYIWYTVVPHAGVICNVDLTVTYIWYTVCPHTGAICNVDLTVTYIWFTCLSTNHTNLLVLNICCVNCMLMSTFESGASLQIREVTDRAKSCHTKYQHYKTGKSPSVVFCTFAGNTPRNTSESERT